MYKQLLHSTTNNLKIMYKFLQSGTNIQLMETELQTVLNKLCI